MSYSSLVDYTLLSPNHSGKRTHTIDRITPHCFVGQVTAERGAEVFLPSSRGASCNYVIAKDGRIALVVDEDNRSWCSSSNANDQQAITIECASDTTYPYTFNDACYNKLIELTIDICKRYNKTKLVWISNKDEALSYEPKENELQITVHRWFAAKSCPGDWLMGKMDDYVEKVNSQISNNISYVEYSHEDFIENIAKYVNKIKGEFGIEVASPIIAQAINESAWGTSNKAKHNNYFGLKYREGRLDCNCGTFIDSSSEQLENSSYIPITDQWYEFKTMEDGVRGYFQFTNIDRYKNVKGVKDPFQYISLLKNDGYATSLNYVNNIMNLITTYDLAKYDNIVVEQPQEVKKYYRVRTSWDNAKSQLGAYEILDNAKNNCPVGYSVFDWNGNVVFSNIQEQKQEEQTQTLKVGDEIKLVSNATYYNGGSIPEWVFNSKLYYRGTNENGIIFSTQKTGAITGVVSKDMIVGNTQVTTNKKSSEEIAKEVLQGLWGNGQDRKDKLAAAGYDYKTIQDIVNKLCS